MPNRLAESTSPYLLQHANNPVDWQEWGPEAFAEAKRRDVPVLLSVGYSACHWCHVMAHESFEDQATAEVMNAGFVNVKVDREERPDVDSIYMEAVQTMTGQGGWPMTLFLTPDAEPFFAGTYFPKSDRPGLPSFRRVMAAIAEAWRERKSEVVDQAAKVASSIANEIPASPELPDSSVLVRAYQELAANYDPENGGFGRAPKFPQEPVLEFLLRIHRQEWAPNAAPMLRHTLQEMARGGIYDHLGGGFARYSVDDHWLVPHFEKMLYDNAQLAYLYLWAWKELGEPEFRRVAVETLGYLLNDLRHPNGGFYSAEDADSEGVEGRFYVWSLEEFFELAGTDDGPIAAAYFGVSIEGNFEGENILHQARTTQQVAIDFGKTEREVLAAVDRAKAILLNVRNKRVRPGLDDKVVTSWNGLTIRALAAAGVLIDDTYLQAARDCGRFVLENLRSADGRLLRSWAKDRGGVAGFLEDYAGLALGLLDLYRATGEVEWFVEAERLVDQVIGLFADPGNGFFTTGSDADPLLKRPKDLFDNPLPSGNSMAAEALLLLSLYTGRQQLRDLAEEAIRAGGVLLDRYATAAAHLAAVLATIHQQPKELAIVGPDPDGFLSVLHERYRPGVVVARATNSQVDPIVPLLVGRPGGDATLAYLCEGFSCLAPTSDPDQLSGQLG